MVNGTLSRLVKESVDWFTSMNVAYTKSFPLKSPPGGMCRTGRGQPLCGVRNSGLLQNGSAPERNVDKTGKA